MTAHQTIPAESLYWAILDTSALPPASSAKRREQLGFLFERYVPRPIEQIQPAYVQATKDVMIACGIDRERLATVESLTLTPRSISDCIASQLEELPATESFNLLIGEFEPIRVRSIRRRWLTQLAAAAAVVLVFMLIGVERRVHAAHAVARSTTDAVATAHATALGPSVDGGPQYARITSELRRLRQTRRADSNLMPTDLSPDLAAWLAHWPAEPPTQTTSITVTDTAMSIDMLVKSIDDAQPFIAAMAPPEGWAATQPNMRASADTFRLTLRVEKEAP